MAGFRVRRAVVGQQTWLVLVWVNHRYLWRNWKPKRSHCPVL